MQATQTSPWLGASRQTGLIAVAILAAAALAAGAVLLEPPARAGSTSPAGPQGSVSALVPVGIVGDSAVAGDPSVPRASTVFRDSSGAVEELPATF